MFSIRYVGRKIVYGGNADGYINSSGTILMMPRADRKYSGQSGLEKKNLFLYMLISVVIDCTKIQAVFTI